MHAADNGFDPRADWARFRPGPMAGVTLMNAHFTEHAFERHSHETFSIGVTLEGVQTFHCDGAFHASTRGDIILFNPDQAHDGRRGTREGFGYVMLYAERHVLEECRGGDAGGAREVHFARPLVRDPQAAEALWRAAAAAGQQQESLRGEELTREALMLLMRRHGERPGEVSFRPPGQQRMERAREFLCAHYDRDVTVEELATHTGLSRPHLSRAFTRHFGVPPHAFLNSVRLGQARRQMLDGVPLAEVALACGFSDQSHFSRRFKGSVGIAPAAWLRQMAA